MTTSDTISGVPRWLRPSIDVKEGRDPLGLQTTTQDRLTPRLLPGILELSRRARYFSFHTYMLDRYRSLGWPADGNQLSAFIKRREWEFGLAVFHCPHNCGSIPVGANRLREALENPGPFPRGESVESRLGGYGLYYRSPLADLGIVARAGTLLGDAPIPIDVLYNHERAQRLVQTFAESVADTDYITSWMLTTDPIPADILVEYARVACLCQLDAHPQERAAIQDALFGDDPFGLPDRSDNPDDGDAGADETVQLSSAAAVNQRRRSVAHFLTLIDYNHDVVDDEGAYRDALWSAPRRSTTHERIAGEWAGLVAKDVWQDSLCSLWAEFCSAGLAATRAADGSGLSWSDTRALAQSMTTGPPSVDGATPTARLVAHIADGTIRLPGLPRAIPDCTLEELRFATDATNTATSGLVVILELHRRIAGRSDPGWRSTAGVQSAWQPSLLQVMAGLSGHLRDDPTIGDTMWWLVDRFVVAVHERIAYSKLQQREHTFRFRWEDGKVRFYNNGIGRFPLAAIRNEPLASLTYDLGFWERDDANKARLAERGRTFALEMLS